MVAKVHNEARLFAEMGFEILLIGQRGHDEIVGTTGEAPEHITLVESPAEVNSLVTADSDRLVWLSQTTLSVDETMETVCSLRQKYPTMTDPPSDDICYATQNRQAAVRLIAPESDLLVVIGSRHSSNSVRLAEVAKLAGAGCVHQVEDATEFELGWLDGVETVGLAAGASVPPTLVDEVVELLRRNGFPPPIQECVTVEKMVFPLPAEVLDEPPAV
jgi:4-hydroxy-3-methylbut-2-enyl diphosphate reductase